MTTVEEVMRVEYTRPYPGAFARAANGRRTEPIPIPSEKPDTSAASVAYAELELVEERKKRELVEQAQEVALPTDWQLEMERDLAAFVEMVILTGAGMEAVRQVVSAYQDERLELAVMTAIKARGAKGIVSDEAIAQLVVSAMKGAETLDAMLDHSRQALYEQLTRQRQRHTKPSAVAVARRWMQDNR